MNIGQVEFCIAAKKHEWFVIRYKTHNLEAHTKNTGQHIQNTNRK